MKNNIIYGTTKCINKIKDKSSFFDTRKCKTKLLNLRKICTFKRNIKPPFKKGWQKHYLFCNTKILKPPDTQGFKCNRSIDKKGKFVKLICKNKINDVDEICTYARSIHSPFKIGKHKDTILCKTTVLKPGKSSHLPANLKCKHKLDKIGKITKTLCKNKTDTILRQCKYTTKKPLMGTLKLKCTRPKSRHKKIMSKQTISKKIRGGTVTPLPDVMSMFGTLGNSIQSMMSTLYVPPTAAYNPSLPISSNPSSQYLLSPLTQPISTIYKSL